MASRPWLAIFFLSSIEPCPARLPSHFLSFSQTSAHIPRTSPIFLDFGHPNLKNASFSKNNP